MTVVDAKTGRADWGVLYQGEDKRQLLLTVLEKSSRPVFNRFRRCGFSPRTIYALVAQGIDSPDNLLDAEPGSVPSLSPTSLEEIERYRCEHIADQGERRHHAPPLSPDE